MTPEERYGRIVKSLVTNPGVTQLSDLAQPKKGFGSTSLRINNKIFAMLVRGKFVVKIPPHRVDALIASGDGRRFEPRPGRPMKEWLTLEPSSEIEWLSLAREAMKFVASKR